MSTFIMSKDLDVWFLSLELKQLARMFTWPADMDANEFIDSCNECWYDMSSEDREDFYNRYR